MPANLTPDPSAPSTTAGSSFPPPGRHSDPSSSSASPISASSSVAFPALPASSTSQHLAAHQGNPDDANGYEMAPIAGHRRRKSSLMNPVGGHLSAPSGRTSPHNAGPGHRPRHSGSFSGQSATHELSPTAGPAHERDDWSQGSFSDDDLQDDEEMGLTAEDRARKQKQRRRATRLDQRIAREKNLPAQVQRDADNTVTRRILINAGLIMLWYIFSLSISLVSCRPYPGSSYPETNRRSTTNGCLTRTGSTLPFRSLRRRCTCSSSSRSPPSFCTSSPVFDRTTSTLRISDARGTKPKPTRAKCPSCTTSPG